MSIFSERILVLTVSMQLFAGAAARGHDEPLQFTSFATIDIKSPVVTGTLSLEFEAMDYLHHLDRNRDGQYTDTELWAKRRAIEAYLNERLLMMWQGRIHPLELTLMEMAKRPGIGHRFLKLGFIVRDLPPAAPVTIASDLLRDFSKSAVCMTLITHSGRQEMFVLGLADYYRSARPPLPKAVGSTYRPRSQRGRIATAGDHYLEMLYALPEGSFYLYVLGADRETPHGIEAQPIKALIRAGGKQEPATPVVLAPRPLRVDITGLSSQYVGSAPEFKQTTAESFSVDMTIGAGADGRRLLFDFPAVTMPSEEQAAAAARRYACPSLCTGVESDDPSVRCMRCGSELLAVHGAAVPGVGIVGRHGGSLKKLGASGLFVEALLPSADELRLYVTDQEMKPRPVGEISGVVSFSPGQDPIESGMKVDLTLAEDSSYLSAEIPAHVSLPLTAHCELQLGEESRPEHPSFYLHEIIELAE